MIPFKNTTQRYGLQMQFLHWSIAIIVFVEISLVYIRDYIPETEPLNLLLILIHKGIGVFAIFIALLFCLAHFTNIKPILPLQISKIEKILSHVTHNLLLLIILIMPVSGFLMSILNGRSINMYFFTIPGLATPNESLAGLLHSVHVYVSYALIGIVTLHIAAALRHHFWLHDDILRRILPVKISNE